MQLYMIPLVSKGTTKHGMNKQHQAPEPRKIIATCPRYMGFQSIQCEQKDINHKRRVCDQDHIWAIAVFDWLLA